MIEQKLKTLINRCKKIKELHTKIHQEWLMDIKDKSFPNYYQGEKHERLKRVTKIVKTIQNEINASQTYLNKTK